MLITACPTARNRAMFVVHLFSLHAAWQASHGSADTREILPFGPAPDQFEPRTPTTPCMQFVRNLLLGSVAAAGVFAYALFSSDMPQPKALGTAATVCARGTGGDVDACMGWRLATAPQRCAQGAATRGWWHGMGLGCGIVPISRRVLHAR